jgi:hypothetical protein
VFILAAALVAAPWAWWGVATAILSCLGLLVLNAGFYRFLWRVRGPVFTLAAVPWHWLYYACAGVGFVIGAGQEVLGRPALALQVDVNPGDSRVR